MIEIEGYLLEVEGCDINQTDSMGKTPASLADWNRYERVVEILLKRDDVCLEKSDNVGQTLLCSAFQNSHR